MISDKTPAEEKALQLHCARVYLREAIARRSSSPSFSKTLLQWAGNARRRAAAIDVQSAQPDLFGRSPA